MVGFDAFMVIMGKLKTMLREKILEYVCISIVSVIFFNQHKFIDLAGELNLFALLSSLIKLGTMYV